MYEERIHLACEEERKLRDFIKKFTEERARVVQEKKLEEDDGIRHTGGNFIV